MIQYDSRKIKQGDAFLAMGKGASFISPELIKKCKKIIKLTKPEVYDYLIKLWDIDISKIKIIGITGTNGKTTTTYLLDQILRKAGHKTKVIGTINSSLTTPEIFDILLIIKKMIYNGDTHLIMEVSSVSIKENRVTGLPFEVKCLTNITQDHLDYHGTFKDYVDSKFKFLKLSGITIYPRDYKKITIDFPIKLLGEFNKHNCQASFSIALAIGIDKKIIKNTLKKATPPVGRFQMVNIGDPYKVIVDYAHTPDALENVLRTAKKLTKNKLIALFGAGGDRDHGKRPLMAATAAKWCDYLIISSDNPRNENPQQIIKDLLSGLPDTIAKKNTTNLYEVIIDRESAIKRAIEIIQPGDVLIIAGKGHEKYQIIGTKKIHFDDFEIAKKYLAKKL